MLKYTKVKEVVLTVSCGAEIGNVLREAALLALEERRDVVFEFNGKNYKVSPLEIVEFLSSRLANKACTLTAGKAPAANANR